MITDRQLVDLAAALYDPASSWTAGPFLIDGNYFALQRIGDDWAMVPRGSITFEDWLRDGISFIPTDPPFGFERMGKIPLGFSKGLLSMFDKMMEVTGAPSVIYFGCHSLGAAHGGQLAIMTEIAGREARGALFAPPRFCLRPALSFISKGEGEGLRGYRNHHDPVPHEPPNDIEPWGDLPGPDLDEKPDRLAMLRPLARHSIALYRAGLYRLFPEAVAA